MLKKVYILYMKKIVIFDLDGTLATIDERMQLATGGKTTESDYTKINWDVLHDPENIALDVPNKPIVEICQLMFQQGYTIYIFSGRSDRTEKATRLWLLKNEIAFDKLVMRPHTKEEMYTPDEVLKKRMLSKHIENKNDVLCVYDDRQKVVDMWREEDLVCCQVAPGNF